MSCEKLELEAEDFPIILEKLRGLFPTITKNKNCLGLGLKQTEEGPKVMITMSELGKEDQDWSTLPETVSITMDKKQSAIDLKINLVFIPLYSMSTTLKPSIKRSI